MKTNKILMIILAVCMALALSGCQLAREDAGEGTEKNGDRLIGVFITTEYLDLFDMEGYLNDNLNRLSGGEITLEGDNSQYQGRLYATLATQTLTNEETDETSDIREFVFEGIKGISYFGATVPGSENEDSYVTSGSDEAITDGHMGVDYGDGEDKMSLEGTIYVSPDYAGKTCYFNPVYQSADGSVYAVSGSGLMADGMLEGSVYSQTLDETTTITENGKSKAVSTSIKISLTVMFPPEQIVVMQMDKDSTVISRIEYAPGELPDTLTPDKGTEYILVETYKHDREGNQVVSRSIYDTSNETMEAFYRSDNDICVKQSTQLDWSKN